MSLAKRVELGLAWCLAWGESRDPAHAPASLQQMVRALRSGDKAGIPSELGAILRQIQQFQQSSNHFPKTLQALQALYPDVWQQQSRIGLVYGGATKIKGYVFESAKLAEVRGASALLDRINLV
ncbi:MAG: hypothetical protein Q6K99_06145, partial [Thermostichales cyanobacterium BF4_bins_65]